MGGATTQPEGLGAFPLPKNGPDPHGVAVVEDVVGQEGQGRVALVPDP